MARTVIWTEAAAEDLDEAAEFIARDSMSYARALVREARVAALSLRNLSDRGRTVPESEDADTRELFIKGYRLIYQINGDKVFILAFIHGARDLKTIWEQNSH